MEPLPLGDRLQTPASVRIIYFLNICPFSCFLSFFPFLKLWTAQLTPPTLPRPGVKLCLERLPQAHAMVGTIQVLVLSATAPSPSQMECGELLLIPAMVMIIFLLLFKHTNNSAKRLNQKISLVCFFVFCFLILILFVSAVYCSADSSSPNVTWLQTQSGTTATSTCNTGYYSSTSPQRTCTQNGGSATWSAVSNPCSRKFIMIKTLDDEIWINDCSLLFLCY